MFKTKRKNQEDYPSQKEALQLNLRALRTIFHAQPQAILSRFTKCIWEKLTPYVGIWLTAQLLNELAGGRNEQALLRLTLLILGSAAVIALVKALLTKWENTANAVYGFEFDNILSEKMLSMDYARIDDPKTHELYSQIRQYMNSGTWGLPLAIEQTLDLTGALLSLFGGIALTASLFTSRVPADAGNYTVLNHPLFLVLLAALMILITWLAPAISNQAEKIIASHANDHILANRLFSFYGFLGMRDGLGPDIRIYGQEQVADRHTGDKTDAFSSQGMYARLGKGKVGILNAVSASVSVLFTGIAYLFVCLKAMGGAFGVGSVTQYVASISNVSDSISKLFSTVGGMRSNAVFLRLTFEFLDLSNDMYQGSLTVEKRSDRDYEIEFLDVSFRYPGSESYALRHVNMKFSVGKRLAVVGPNGSGKTTFIKLLCRLYDPTEGEILLNGINIRKYNYAEYISVFSVVFQDFFLFPYQLGQNVAAKTSFDAKLAAQCLCDAGFGKRLQELPDGLDTYLYKRISKDGMDISGGEAQKIALARTMYKDAPFLILDEPTSALDPLAEAAVYENFNRIVGDRTAIYISHRLSSCRFCDEIAVFSEGSVVQMGNHETLVADTNGLYAQLWNAQAQYYVG